MYVRIEKIKKYLDNFKPTIKDNNFGGLFKIKYKNHFLIIDTERPPKQKFSKSYQSGPLSFEYFLDGIKIITNCGFGNHLSSKAVLISRLTASQSTLTINDTSSCLFQKNSLIRSVCLFGILKLFNFLNCLYINCSLVF